MYSTLLEKINRKHLLQIALNLGSGETVPPYHFQSATYVSSRDSIILGFNLDLEEEKNPTNKALLVEMDSVFAVLKGAYEIDGLYHCNDMTYSPNTNKIYVALCDDKAPGIGVINASTMQKEGENIRFNLTQYGGDCFAHISYDVDNDTFYLGNARALHITNGNFAVTKSVLTPNYGVFYNEGRAVPEPMGATHNTGLLTAIQGSDVINGEFARVWSVSEGGWDADGKSYTRCTLKSSRVEFYDFDTGEVTHFVDFPTLDRYQEAEAVITVDGIHYLIGSDETNIVVEKILLRDEKEYNFLGTDQQLSTGSGASVANSAVAQHVYHKYNNDNLKKFALELPPGVHAVQNGENAKPEKFRDMMSIVVKNKSGDRCSIFTCGNQGGIYVNTCTNGQWWSGWGYSATPSFDFNDDPEQ